MKVVISNLDSLLVSVASLPQSDHEIARDFQPKKKMTFLASRVLLRLALKSFYALNDVPSLSFVNLLRSFSFFPQKRLVDLPFADASVFGHLLHSLHSQEARQ